MEKFAKFKLKLVREVGGSYKQYESYTLDNPSILQEAFRKIFKLQEEAEEVLVLLVMDSKLQIIGAFEVHRGSIDSSICSPASILKRVLLANGSRFAIAHNHPSGNATASRADIATTENLAKASHMLGLDFIDHVIIGDTNTSLRMEYPGIF